MLLGGGLLGDLVMDRQVKIFLAAIACVALTADASVAAGRHGHGSKSAPQTSKAVPHEETAGDHPAKSETGEQPVRNPTRESDKSGKAEHDIDLVRHDDGYINLRRRATRPSLVAAKKKLQIVPPVAVTSHPSVPAGATVEPVRNSAGVTVPAVKKPDPIAAVPEVAAKPGLAKNSVGLSVNEIHRPEVHVTATGAVVPVTGINGTTMGHAGVGGIGGPAKDRSAIGGSTYHKF
jgi:hypothetical protein